MGRLLTLNEGLEEVRRLVSEGHGLIESIDKVKSYSQADQNKGDSNKITVSIAENEDIDNGKVFDKENGETLRDLI